MQVGSKHIKLYNGFFNNSLEIDIFLLVQDCAAPAITLTSRQIDVFAPGTSF
jgi:hypothetical protein